MSERTRTVQVLRRWTIEDTVDVELRQPADEADVAELVDRLFGELEVQLQGQRASVDTIEIIDAVPLVKRLDEPPAEAWTEELDGHRWATDGHLVIRDDAPRPHRRAGRTWVVPPPDVVALFPRAADVTDGPPPQRRVPAGAAWDRYREVVTGLYADLRTPGTVPSFRVGHTDVFAVAYAYPTTVIALGKMNWTPTPIVMCMLSPP